MRAKSVQVLPAEQQELWSRYLEAEAKFPRYEKLEVLDLFLDSLERLPNHQWEPWARWLAAEVVDNNLNLVIRMPLFRRVVFPALLSGYRERMSGCARWLAGLRQLLYKSKESQIQLPNDEWTEISLLRTALQHDPNDKISRRRLLQILADCLRYSLHEIPAGVLYGMDGASPEQCFELEQEVQEFSQIANQEQMTAQYQPLIDDCLFHFRAYRDYLGKMSQFESYEDYLTRIGRGARTRRE